MNFFEYWEEWKWVKKGKPTTKKRYFSWITDREITTDNVKKLIQGGRSRWSIENETFNMLKNQGYEFEHNFGHGKKNLSTNFAMLMMLCFLLDQSAQIGCSLFKKALEVETRKLYLWEAMRSIFRAAKVETWEQWMRAVMDTS